MSTVVHRGYPRDPLSYPLPVEVAEQTPPHFQVRQGVERLHALRHVLPGYRKGLMDRWEGPQVSERLARHLEAPSLDIDSGAIPPGNVIAIYVI